MTTYNAVGLTASTLAGLVIAYCFYLFIRNATLPLGDTRWRWF